jgi:hypothetical protein
MGPVSINLAFSVPGWLLLLLLLLRHKLLALLDQGVRNCAAAATPLPSHGCCCSGSSRRA